MPSLRPRTHEIVSCVQFGLGSMLMFAGYLCTSFISESILNSIYQDNPDTISQFAGYYGGAIQFGALAISSIVTPSVVHFLTSKWSLVLSSFLFALYYVGFAKVTWWYFYLSQTFVGFGYALYNNCEGAYLSEHSTWATIEPNTAIEIAIGHQCMLVGGLVLLVVFLMAGVGLPQSFGDISYLHFSENKIRLLYGSYLGVSLLSILIFTFLPTKQYNSIASTTQRKAWSFVGQLKSLGETLLRKNMLILSLAFLYQGIFTSFYLAVFPTTFSFAHSLNTHTHLVAYYGICLGIGEFIGGLFVSFLSRRIRNFSLTPTMLCHAVFSICFTTLLFLAFPTWSTARPSPGEGIVLSPTVPICIVCGLLVGLADSTITTARTVICQIAVPHRRPQAFSLSRLIQSVSSSIVLFLSPEMSVTIWTVTLLTSLAFGTASFGYVAMQATKVSPDEQNHDTAQVKN
uniref:UNC93-like protein MFSD11 n=1 Tax=Haemonchus contortus TaxID=6289 RepID=A0A7I4YMX9_HAECO